MPTRRVDTQSKVILAKLTFDHPGDEGVPAVLGAERHPGAGREPDPVPRQGELHAALPRGGLLHLPADTHSSD